MKKLFLQALQFLFTGQFRKLLLKIVSEIVVRFILSDESLSMEVQYTIFFSPSQDNFSLL